MEKALVTKETSILTAIGTTPNQLEGAHNAPTQNRAAEPETTPVPFSTVPFLRDVDYVERAQLLHELDEKMSKGRSRIALCGLGGIGKSQLAIEYAYRVRERCPQTWVLWIHASSLARFEQSVSKSVHALRIPGKDDPKKNKLKLLRDWLLRQGKQNVLLILDDADETGFLVESPSPIGDAQASDQPLIEYLSSNDQTAILITSRSRNATLQLTEDRDIIHVQPMDEKLAVELLAKKLGYDKENPDLRRLATSLEFTPLAITQAAASIKHRRFRFSVGDYVKALEKNKNSMTSLLNLNRAEPALHRDREASSGSILATWQISFEHICEIRPSAAELLCLMSLCDCNGIPDSLLRPPSERSSKRALESTRDRKDGADESTSESSEDEVGMEFEDDIVVLKQFSLIAATIDPSTFEMHRLVQFATRRWLKSREQELEKTKERFCTQLRRSFPSAEFENWSVCETLFPHVKSAMELKPEGRAALLDWAAILTTGADYARSRGAVEDAEAMSVLSWQVSEQLLEP